MRIAVIHGQMHHGSTYHAVHQLLEHYRTLDGSVQINEFFLPKDGPDHCVGCYQCFNKGEQFCPHYDKVGPIVAAMEQADLVVIGSPTYAFEMTGQLKTLLDHLGYMWLSHRPNGHMFRKQGVVVSTTAGAGAKNVVKSLKRQLFWIGISQVHSLAFRVGARNWQEVNEKTRRHIAIRTRQTAVQTAGRVGQAGPTWKERFMFGIMRKMQGGNTWAAHDRAHWETRGWLGKTRPWKVNRTKTKPVHERQQLVQDSLEHTNESKER